MERRASISIRLLAALVLSALAALGVRAMASGQAPWPFVGWDMALVHVACAVPLAALLAATLRRRTSEAAAVALGMLVLVAVFALTQDGAGRQDVDVDAGHAVRAAAGLAFAFVAALNLGVAIDGSSTSRPMEAPGLGSGLLWLVVLLAAPATFTAARVQRDLDRLDELVDQERFGEAAALAHRVLALDSGAEFRQEPLSDTAARLDAVVEQLEARVAVPLPKGASAGQRLDRARQLAKLGRVREALDASERIDDAALAADVANLRGTIHEARDAWDEGRAAFQEAKAHLDEKPPSPERDAALARAVTGIAYCERKSGDYAGAEAAYHELLALVPTADSHFLLAQFYEDTQQTAAAHVHARRAMELDPEQYGRRGEQLIRKLAVFHFGCWSVYGSR